MPDISTTVDVNTVSPQGVESTLFTPNIYMVILTWVLFLLLLGILYKFAWKPILKALDDREALIRRSVDEAERVVAELAKIDRTREQVILEAQGKAKKIIDDARRAAVEATHTIEDKAREETKILLENAKREIREETQRAQAKLREESAHVAVSLAGKLIEQKLDEAKDRKLIDELLKEI